MVGAMTIVDSEVAVMTVIVTIVVSGASGVFRLLWLLVH
jgi:hypothetical protein